MFHKRPLNRVHDAELKEGLTVGNVDVMNLVVDRLSDMSQETVSLLIDGTHGSGFSEFAGRLKKRCEAQDYEVTMICTDLFLKSGEEIRQYFKNNITDNRAFGYVTDETIDAYFQADAKEKLTDLLNQKHCEKKAKKQVIIVCGVGAYWLFSEKADLTMFLDVSRELQQRRHKEGLCNFGFQDNADAVEKYKIAYFVEWPILENYRKKHFNDFHYYVDLNSTDNPVIAKPSDLVKMMADVARNPFRVKPFFSSGIWGGQYLKKIAGLPEDMKNSAWGFEPIAPENSILLEYEGTVIELPFLVVMSHMYRQIMGGRVVHLFGDYFPVRFDYLDTIEGTNLSCQVHPKQDYLRKHFNEPLEQQESYYIMENKGNSKVYLGLTEECEKEEFRSAVSQSQETGEPIAFTDYVQEWDSHKGDLFLIPTGTVHCSGKDNLVLEISATTWWFTMKIYDYVRKDADGKPRPINIDHAFNNIEFTRKTEWVKDNLIQKPKFLKSVGSNEEYQLGKRDDLLFYVNRIHLTDNWQDDTNGEFIMLNLVHGDRVSIVPFENPAAEVSMEYAESYIIPAETGKFTIVNHGNGPCKIIKAGVSPDWSVKIADESLHSSI